MPEKEIISLLGKSYAELDPENNDLKALVSYGIGKGIIKDNTRLLTALESDSVADPLHFLSEHSGKTFGEKYAPMFAQFWLQREGDEWRKQKSTELYDVLWKPQELDGSEIRIELKASSEHPSYRFQQVRHHRLSGEDKDYDLLLCAGVCAASIEWWAIPVELFDDIADNGDVAPDQIVIRRHHGKQRQIWNDEFEFTDEGWFSTDDRVRELLIPFSCSKSEELRKQILALFAAR